MAGYGSMDSVHDESSVEGERQDAPRRAEAVEAYGEGAGGPRGRDNGGGDQFHWRASATNWSRSSGTLLVAVVIAWFIQLPYYALTPARRPR